MADIGISGNQQIYGSVIGNRVDLSGNGAVHYDETLAKHEEDSLSKFLCFIGSEVALI